MNALQMIEKDGTIFLIGAINLDNVTKWRSLGEQMIAQKQGTITINFLKVAQTDMSVLSLMMCWLRLATSLGIKLFYIDVPDHVLSISELYGIKEFLPLAYERE